MMTIALAQSPESHTSRRDCQCVIQQRWEMQGRQVEVIACRSHAQPRVCAAGESVLQPAYGP